MAETMVTEDIFRPDVNVEGYIHPLKRLVAKFKPKKGLEIGFCWGASAYAYLEATDGTLLSVDLSDHKGRAPLFKEAYKDRWDIIYGDSREVIPSLKEKFDYIYVDGEHWYENAKADIENSWPLLKKGGIMVCDDYNEYEREGGVMKAVDEFAKTHKLKIRKIRGHANGAIYFVK